MKSLLMLELLLITFIFFVGKGLSFKCFQCRSDNDDDCSSNVNNSWSKDCPDTPSNGTNGTMYCRKIYQQLKFKNEKGWTSIRECAYEKHGSDCYHFKWMEIGYQITCECEGENCNLGKSYILEIWTIVLALAVSWIANYLKMSNT